MEEVTGGTLEDLLFRKVKISMSQPLCLKLCVEIVDALSYLHNQNPPFVHCGLKPQNVLLTNDYTVKLADFGAVTIVRATQTTSSFQDLSNNQFTPLYCAPEILKNTYKQKCSSDIYSYAMIIYEILIRKRVFISSGVNLDLIMYKIKNDDFKPNMEFVDEIEKCLAADCDDMFIFLHLKNIMIKCWSTIPSERPTAFIALDELQTVIASTSTSSPSLQAVEQLSKTQPRTFDKYNKITLVDCTLQSNNILPLSYNLTNYLSLHLEITYKIVRNLSQDALPQTAILKNTGYQNIPSGNNSNWAIFLNSSHLSKTQYFDNWYMELANTSNFKLSHIDGTLYKLTPTSEFRGLKPNESVNVYFNSYSVASRYCMYPRWYVCVPGEKPQIIKNTNEDEVGIVSNFNVLVDYQGSFNEFTPAKRCDKYNIVDLGCAPMRIVPKIVFTKLHSTKSIIVDSSMFFSIFESQLLKNEQAFTENFYARILTKTIKLPFQPKHINCKQDVVTDVRQCDEAYQIIIDSKTNSIDITAHARLGIFYATQTLNALAETQSEALKFPTGVIKDAPRYDYRGLMIDTVSNFIQVDDLLLIIKVMAMYKLNKLILQLSNNEGWRIEIDDLPE